MLELISCMINIGKSQDPGIPILWGLLIIYALESLRIGVGLDKRKFSLHSLAGSCTYMESLRTRIMKVSFIWEKTGFLFSRVW